MILDCGPCQRSFPSSQASASARRSPSPGRSSQPKAATTAPVPYAGYLAEHAAASVVRMRRDFGVLLGMIEAHAVLHQVNRKRDQYGRIIATPGDYEAVVGILADAFAITSDRKVKEAVRNAVAAVAELGGQETTVTVAQVARYLKRDRKGNPRAERGHRPRLPDQDRKSVV